MNKITMFIFISFLVLSCNSDPNSLLIGRWEVVKFEPQEELTQKEEKERKKIIGTIIEFKEGGKLVFELDGPSQESNWEIKEDVLIINNHTYIKILELNKRELVLEGTLDYLEEGEVKTFKYIQTMKKI